MKKGLYLIVNSRTVSVVAMFFLTFVLIIVVLTANSTVAVNSTNGTIRPVVIIDAGHGGEDGGTQSSDGVLEKDINLKIATNLNNILNRYGLETVMVRTDDRMIYDDNCKTVRQRKSSDLHNRMDIMKKYPGSIFISIHQNHFTESKYSGAQVFYCKNCDGSPELAGFIQNSIVENLQKDNKRAIKPCDSNVYLIYNAVTTAVMVECGFLSNPVEAHNLTEDTYQYKMALSVAEGIFKYIQFKGS